MVASLKILKWHLLSDGKGLSWNLVGGIGETWRFRTAKFVPFRHQSWPTQWPSWNSSNNISQTWIQIESQLDGKHQRNTEIQNCWIPSGRILSEMASKVAILKIFKPHLLQNGKSDWAKNWWEALGRPGDSELLKTLCYDIHDGHHSIHLEDLLLLAHLELCFRSAYAMGRFHGQHGCHLENLQITSAPER